MTFLLLLTFLVTHWLDSKQSYKRFGTVLKFDYISMTLTSKVNFQVPEFDLVITFRHLGLGRIYDCDSFKVCFVLILWKLTHLSRPLSCMKGIF